MSVGVSNSEALVLSGGIFMQAAPELVPGGGGGRVFDLPPTTFKDWGEPNQPELMYGRIGAIQYLGFAGNKMADVIIDPTSLEMDTRPTNLTPDDLAVRNYSLLSSKGSMN